MIYSVIRDLALIGDPEVLAVEKDADGMEKAGVEACRQTLS
jgi:hypothetical protein